MKLLSRINRGLIVTTIVLIAVIVYLIFLTISQESEKPKIMDTCEQYIETALKYKMLPEKYRIEKPEIPQSELDQYIEDMSRDLKALYIDNELAYKQIVEQNKTSLLNQAQGIDVIYDYSKEINGFKELKFDGNTVITTVSTNSSFDGPNPYTAKKRETSVSATEEKITLEKVKGKWKVVYADLQLPLPGNMRNGVYLDKSYSTVN